MSDGRKGLVETLVSVVGVLEDPYMHQVLQNWILDTSPNVFSHLLSSLDHIAPELHRVQLLFSHGSWSMQHDKLPWVVGGAMLCNTVLTPWVIGLYNSILAPWVMCCTIIVDPMGHGLCNGMPASWVMGCVILYLPMFCVTDT